jgi:hypothetical protein
MSEQEFDAQIPEEIQVAILTDFLQTAVGHGITTLVELTGPTHSEGTRLTAALALVGADELIQLPEQQEHWPIFADDPGDDLGPPTADVEWQGDVPDHLRVVNEHPYEADIPVEESSPESQAWHAEQDVKLREEAGLITTEEALARLQALGQTAEDVEEQEGAGSLGGASGIGPRNARGSRKRRKHGRNR